MVWLNVIFVIHFCVSRARFARLIAEIFYRWPYTMTSESTCNVKRSFRHPFLRFVRLFRVPISRAHIARPIEEI